MLLGEGVGLPSEFFDDPLEVLDCVLGRIDNGDRALDVRCDLGLVLVAHPADLIRRHLRHRRPCLVQGARRLGGSPLGRVQSVHCRTRDAPTGDRGFLLGVEPPGLHIGDPLGGQIELTARLAGAPHARAPFRPQPCSASDDGSRSDDTGSDGRCVVGRRGVEPFNRSTDSARQSGRDFSVREERVHASDDVVEVIIEPLIEVVAVADGGESVPHRDGEHDRVVGDVGRGVERLRARTAGSCRQFGFEVARRRQLVHCVHEEVDAGIVFGGLHRGSESIEIAQLAVVIDEIAGLLGTRWSGHADHHRYNQQARRQERLHSLHAENLVPGDVVTATSAN